MWISTKAADPTIFVQSYPAVEEITAKSPGSESGYGNRIGSKIERFSASEILLPQQNVIRISQLLE